LPRFDQRADVTQIGAVALSLILGRRLHDDEAPARLGDLVSSAWAVSARGGLEPLPAGLRAWLMCALQLDARNSFESAIDAQEELERVLGESDYLAAPATLESFLERYRAALAEQAVNEPVSAPPVSAPVVSAPVVSQPAINRPVLSRPVISPLPETEIELSPIAVPTPAARPPSSSIRVPAAPARTPSHAPAPTPAATHAPAPPVAPAAPAPAPVVARAPVVAPAPVVTPAAVVAHTPPMVTPAPVVTYAPVVIPTPVVARPPVVASAPVVTHAPIVTPPPVVAHTPLVTPAPVVTPPPVVTHAPVVTPSPVAAHAPVIPAARKEPAFREQPYREPAFIPAPLDMAPEEDDAPKADNGRKRWPLMAAAVVLIAVAGAGVTAARRFAAPSAATADGVLIMTTNPPGAKMFVDGVERGVTPLTVPLKPGSHALELRGDGPARLMPITMTAGAQISQYIELPKTSSTNGQLQVRTEPSGARVSVDGTPRGTSPVTVADLTPGEHAVMLESDKGSVKQIVSIEAGITASLMVPLSGGSDSAPVSGWITVSAPSDVQVFENKRLLGTSQSDRLMVSSGRHDLELVNETLGYRATRSVQVSPGKVTPIKIDFPKGTIALNAVPWAEVWVDGEKVGDTPIGNLSLTIGPHEIVFRHPDLGEQRHAATVTLNSPARLSVDLRKK
jgi:hypothetical protein